MTLRAVSEKMALFGTRKLQGLLGAAALLLLVEEAGAAELSCTEAQSSLEKTVCADEELYSLHVAATLYREVAAMALGDGAACLRADAERWSKTLEACSSDAACLKTTYLERLAMLDDLQEAGSQWQGTTLPAVPVLVSAIPPEGDGATPPDPQAPPDFEARGRLVFETDDTHHSGYALRSEADTTHVVVFLMDIGNSENHAVIRDLIERGPDATFLVRGVAETSSPDGVANFHSDRCRFVYRVP